MEKYVKLQENRYKVDKIREVDESDLDEIEYQLFRSIQEINVSTSTSLPVRGRKGDDKPRGELWRISLSSFKIKLELKTIV